MRRENLLPLLEFETLTIQPVAGRYNDCALKSLRMKRLGYVEQHEYIKISTGKPGKLLVILEILNQHIGCEVWESIRSGSSLSSSETR